MKELIARLEAMKVQQSAAQKAQRDEIKGGVERTKALEAEVKGLRDEIGKISKANVKRLGSSAEPVADTAEQIVSNDAWKSYRASGGKDSPKISVKGFRRKAGAITNAISGGQMSVDRRPGIVTPPSHSLSLRDLLNVQRTAENSVEYVRETGFYNLYTEVDTTANIGATSIILKSVAGIGVGHVLTLNKGKVSEEGVTVLTVDAPTKTITVAATTNQHVAGSTVVGDLITFTPETEVKPQASIDFELANCPTKTLAHWVAASKQVLDDVDQLRDTIDRRLSEGLEYNEEVQLLYGVGGQAQLTGFFADPGIPSYAWASGPATDTKIDAIRRAITLAQLARYEVSAILLHPIEWQDIELAKGVDGHYITGMTVAEGRQPRAWRVPVVVSNSIKQGDALVGAFSLGATIYDRESVDVSASESHEDFFIRNMVAIRAEQRVAFCIERPQAFVKIDLSTAPTPAPES